MSQQTDAVMRRAHKIKELDKQIASASDTVKQMKRQRELYQTEGIEFLEGAKLEGCKDVGWNVSIKETDVPVINDFLSFWKFVKKNNAYELLQRRVNSKAWREHDKKVPGLGSFTKKSLSITKR